MEDEMTSNPAKTPKPKHRLGSRKVNLSDPDTDPKTVGPVFTPKIYISYYYEDQDGDTGFGNVILSNIPDIRTQSQLEHCIFSIREQRGEKFKDVQVLFWRSLEA